ncbi:Uncharacterised protein [Escherichia coli]|uniref:Uncharacterized protein n=1 Tax=Escherichia coli TaxID=562 RepID=A0A376RN92_ECOLX|nr:Uncharacterised protein [Escherichia coli]
MISFQDVRAIRKCTDFVETSGLLAESNERVNLPSNYAPLCRNLAYREYWELHKSKFWFHIKLTDESVFYLKKTALDLL